MINGGSGGFSFSKVYYIKNIFRFKIIFVEIFLVYTILTSFLFYLLYIKLGKRIKERMVVMNSLKGF